MAAFKNQGLGTAMHWGYRHFLSELTQPSSYGQYFTSSSYVTCWSIQQTFASISVSYDFRKPLCQLQLFYMNRRPFSVWIGCLDWIRCLSICQIEPNYWTTNSVLSGALITICCASLLCKSIGSHWISHPRGKCCKTDLWHWTIFAGQLNADLRKLAVNLIPFPKTAFLHGWLHTSDLSWQPAVQSTQCAWVDSANVGRKEHDVRSWPTTWTLPHSLSCLQRTYVHQGGKQNDHLKQLSLCCYVSLLTMTDIQYDWQMHFSEITSTPLSVPSIVLLVKSYQFADLNMYA